MSDAGKFPIDGLNLFGPPGEFFLLQQSPPGEICDDEEREIARSFDLDVIAGMCGIYDRREDAERVCLELNRRKPERCFNVISSKDAT